MKSEDYIIGDYSLEGIRNRYEVIVINFIKKLTPDFPEFASCQACLEDVYALALSRIPCTYVIKDNVTFEDDDTTNENVEEIVRYAIFQVMSKPRHAN